MKLFPNIPAHPHRTNISAFTLVEMMMTVGIYLFIFIGVMIAIQIFALRVYTLSATKLSATASGRQAMNQIRDSIREAKMLQVGTLATVGSPTSFNPISGNTSAAGGALRVYSTTNMGAPYTVYYLDTTTPATNYLRMYSVNAGSNAASIVTLAGYITNTIV